MYDEEILEALQMGIANGSIDIDALKQDVKMKKRETALARHRHNIWQGSDGNWYTYVPDDTKPKNRRKVKNKNRDSLIEYLVFFYTENETQAYVKPNITFKEVYEKWQDYCREVHNVTDRTIDKRDCDYRRFIQDTELDSLPIGMITERHILRFLDNMIKENMGKIGSRAFNNTKGVIAGVFRHAKIYLRVECILIGELLAAYRAPINAFKKVSKENQVFMDDEVEMMIKEIHAKHWNDSRYLAILFMLTTGVRLGEMVAIKTTDFLAGNKLHIQRTLTKSKGPDGKNHRAIEERTKTDSSNEIIYLSEEAMVVYEQMMKVRLMNGEMCEYLMSENGDYISDCKIDKAIRKLCDDLGIQPRGCHKLRKTYCSYLLEINVPAKVVQNQMRHSCFQTTQNHYYYSTKNENAIKEEINKCNRVTAIALSS